jgi:ATP-dependent DNA helicase DinG
MDKEISSAKSRIRSYMADGVAEDVVDRYASLTTIADCMLFGDLDENVVVVDTETTGFSFVHDELIQIAAARMEKGEIVGWYVTFVNPGKPIPEDVVHLTDIHDEDVATAPSPQEALAGLVEFAGDAKMIAHNVEFDRTFTTRHPEGYPLLENDWIDSLDLSRIALPKLKSHRLIDLVHTFDAPISTHRADADVEATCSIYRILLAAVCCMPFDFVEEIAGMADKSQWYTQVVFAYLAKHPEICRAAKNAAAGAGPNTFLNEFASELDEVQVDSAQDAVGQLELQGEGIPAKKKFFSLRAMRSRRVRAMEPMKTKVDANSLAQGENRALDYPSVAEIDAAFSEQGLLSKIYSNCEPRPEQRKMSEAIATAFSNNENLVVEAGTGVGKSMAYLVPAAMLAKKNNITVGVATKTNALLDQLVFQELPALRDALSSEQPEAHQLSFAALKGITHYPCLRKIDRIVSDGPIMKEVAGKEVSQAPALAGLLSFIEQSEYDDIDSLKIDYRSLPRYSITTQASDCLKKKCPYFGTMCFGRGARRRAENADIVVTNHTLLFCDLAADGNLLPPVRYWIVDEAHDAEQEARRSFTKIIDCNALTRLCSKINVEDSSRTVFGRLESRIAGVSGADTTLLYGLSSKCKSSGASLAQTARDLVAHAKDLLYYDTSKNKNYDRIELWLNDEVRHGGVFSGLRSKEMLFADSADKFIKDAQDLVAYLEGIDEAAELQREIASIVLEVKETRQAAELIFESEPNSYAYQATLNRKKDRFEDSFEALPLDIGEKMCETLYARTRSVVYASATVTVAGKFDAFTKTMGLGTSEEAAFSTLQLDSSFDFDNNMIIYVVKDMPEPNSPSYLSALQNLLIATHRAQHGSMLTLFTNRREMENCYNVVQPALKADDLRLVCQKWGVSVKGLRDDFVKDETLSLFALKSFWQGFDAPGATLKGVIIPKLPFARPTDPLYCERATRDDNAWRHYVLPQAIIETKQAAGRLIRKADDSGVLILADKRLLTKGYGKTVLNSMPSKTVRVCTIDEIARALSIMSDRG